MVEPLARRRGSGVEPLAGRQSVERSKIATGLLSGAVIVSLGQPGALTAGDHLAVTDMSTGGELVPVRRRARFQFRSSFNGCDCNENLLRGS